MWETHEAWGETILANWTDGGAAGRLDDLRAKLTRVARCLGSWNKNIFGMVRKEIKSLKKELERLQNVPSRAGPSHIERKISEKLIELYDREELMWR